MSLRIAHLDSGRTWRGGQAQVLLLMRELAARGHAQHLLAPAGPLLERAIAEGFTTTRWNARGELDLFALAAAARVLAKFRADVAHAHSAHAHAIGVPAARVAAVPAVVVARRVDFKVRTNPFSVIKYALPVDRYLCISEGVRGAMLASGVSAARLALVPSGVDFAEVHEMAGHAVPDLRSWLGIPVGAPVVGTVASLAPHKDHRLALDAVALVLRSVPDAHFVWLGEGECRPALERRRAELGLESRVHMPGFHPEPRALMRQFTVFLLSSHLEGLCTSLLDAQVLGVPIVATAVGGVPEVVHDGISGRLIPALEPTLVATAVIESLTHPERRREWAAGGRRTVEAFGISNTAERTLAVYREVLRERGRQA